jgi:hypothetical protein
MEPLDKLDPLCLKTEDVEADLPLDEVIRTLEAPAQEGLNKVSYFRWEKETSSRTDRQMP